MTFSYFWQQIFYREKPNFSPNHYQILKNTCLKQHKKLLHKYSKKFFCLCCYSNGAHYHLICILSSPYSYLSRPREAQAEIMPKTELKVCRIEMDRVQTRKPSDFFYFLHQKWQVGITFTEWKRVSSPLRCVIPYFKRKF